MNTSLAVFTSQPGASFINRHVEDLLPERTVAVFRSSKHQPLSGPYEPQNPVLFLDRWERRLPVRLAKRAGVRDKRLLDAAVRRFLQRHGVTVVLGEYLDQFLDFVPLLERMDLPYVVQGHGIDLSTALRQPGRAKHYLAYRSARAVLTRCEFHRQRLLEIGLSAEKVHVNHGGVDVPARPPQRGDGASKRLLAIGANSPKKGPIYLLEAFRRAALKDHDLTLDYVGSGPLLPAVRQFVDACGLTGRVHVHGVVSEETKFGLLRACGVFVQHSLTDPETGNEEGLPTAIQEAMAHGLAVVSTRHAGIPEAVVEGETGLLVDERDTLEMARAILAVTRSAPAMGRAGHERAAANFSWEHEKQRLLRWLDAERN